MNLAKLRGMLKVLGGKPGPTAQAANSSPEVQEVPVGGTPRVASAPTPKRPTETSMPHPKEFERGILYPQIAKELYSLLSEVLLAWATKQMVWSHHYHMALFDRIHDAGQLVTIMDHRATNFQQEIEELKSGGGPEAMVVAEQQATDLKKENEKLLAHVAKASQRLEALDKELNDAYDELSITQRQLKEQRARDRKADDELLKAMRELEAQRTELLRKAVEDDKGITGFKLGL
ncbi:hypothetical protein BHM03_00061059 [Ensete ventricosum]|nr:hypothetical protein BHM03_00061059 [Ensete ventricosum]